MNRTRDTVIITAVIVAGLATAIALSRAVEGMRPPMPAGYQDEALGLQGAQLKGFVFGAEGLLADWYWMNSLQYMGNKISSVGLNNVDLENLRPLNPRLLSPYLNNATDLDPRFMAPYSYGATILPAIEPHDAIALTEKGIRENPDQWRLYQYLGYIHWRLKDYEKAAVAYDRGAQIPGAPSFFRLMAAKMRSDSGSRDTAREIYRQAMTEAGDGQVKTAAQLRLYQLDALDQLDVINKVLSDHRTRTGRCVSGWREIVSALQPAAVAARVDLQMDTADNLVDPSGVPYRLNREACQAEINWPTSKIPPPEQ
jgi:tetratricopeptide (TPR) repeat protein